MLSTQVMVSFSKSVNGFVYFRCLRVKRLFNGFPRVETFFGESIKTTH